MRHADFIRLVFVPLAAMLAGSCGATANMAVRSDESATLSLSVEVPAAVEAKIRQFAASGGASGGSPAPMFDAAAVASSVSSRGVSVRSSASPSARAYRGAFDIADLGRLIASDDELGAVLDYARGPGWASLRFRADRGNAAAVARLFPGIDEELLEALQPPALYDNPVSRDEYRSMLAGLLGKAAATAIDGLSFSLTVSFPGAVLETGGAAVVGPSGRSASLAIPALDAMVLERPFEFYVKWAE